MGGNNVKNDDENSLLSCGYSFHASLFAKVWAVTTQSASPYHPHLQCAPAVEGSSDGLFECDVASHYINLN